MANQYEDDDFDEIEDVQDQNGPANLRKALKRAEKEKKDLAEQLASIQSDLRSRSVKEVLATKGVPDKVAKFIPSDISTPEQIDSWLTENADVFGFSKTEEAVQADEETQANVTSYQRINAATQNAGTPSRDQDLAAKLAGVKTLDELNALTGNPSARFTRGQ
jgi:predicted  nucleic acid-binding Zn-ribbon protein